MSPSGPRPVEETVRRVDRRAVLAHRVHVQELDADLTAPARSDSAVLDLGVPDTGPDGAGWALALRGVSAPRDDLFLAWSLRGAPHAYRRAEAAGVAAAVAPWSDADAAKRIHDAARPLRAAGIPVRDALRRLAEEMRDVVDEPTVKGRMSGELTARLTDPYLRECRPCQAVHVHEQAFRLAALQAGLELLPGTSPPVLRRLPGWTGPAAEVPEHLDPVRAVLRLLGPCAPRHVAGYLDAPVREVSVRWPSDAVAVEVDGQRLSVLAADAERLVAAAPVGGVRLLGPYDPFLQARDRELLVPDEAARKDLWRVLGRPGGLLVDGELVGSWRPRGSGRRLRLRVELWSGAEPDPALRARLDEMAERLAAHRGQAFEGYVDD